MFIHTEALPTRMRSRNGKVFMHREKYRNFKARNIIIVWDHDAILVPNHEFHRFILRSAPWFQATMIVVWNDNDIGVLN